jgi:S-adenosylmethionine hydrolase
MARKIIVLLTDFGNDFYVGQIKGVIKSIYNNVEIIDLTHNIQPQNVVQAAVVIGESYRYFPKKCIYMCS